MIRRRVSRSNARALRYRFRSGIVSPSADKLIFERLVIFNHAVVDERQFAAGVEVRVRVLVGDFAVRGPASVTDAEACRRPVPSSLVLRAPRCARRICAFPDGHRRQSRRRRSRSRDIRGDAIHREGWVPPQSVQRIRQCHTFRQSVMAPALGRKKPRFCGMTFERTTRITRKSVIRTREGVLFRVIPVIRRRTVIPMLRKRIYRKTAVPELLISRQCKTSRRAIRFRKIRGRSEHCHQARPSERSQSSWAAAQARVCSR